MTDFVFQGSRHARDTVWGDVKYTFDAFSVPVTLGATYYNFTGGAAFENGVFDDFLHTYASFNLGSPAGFDTTFAFNQVFFPEGTGPVVTATSQTVLTLNTRRDIAGFVDLLVGTSYSAGGGGSVPFDFSGGWYHSAGLEKSFGLTDNVSLVLGTGVGYSDHYWVHFWNTGWANYYVNASVPIQLNCRTTLTPYIGYNGGMGDNILGFKSSDSLDSAGGGDVLSGGVSISVAF